MHMHDHFKAYVMFKYVNATRGFWRTVEDRQVWLKGGQFWLAYSDKERARNKLMTLSLSYI